MSKPESKSAPVKKNRFPHQSEWDFCKKSLPDEELRACLLYEYAREVIGNVEELKNRIGTLSINNLLYILGELATSYGIPGLNSQMLKKPWLRLSIGQKKEAIKTGKDFDAIVIATNKERGVEVPIPTEIGIQMKQMNHLEFLKMGGKASEPPPPQYELLGELSMELPERSIPSRLLDCDAVAVDFAAQCWSENAMLNKTLVGLEFGLFCINWNKGQSFIEATFHKWLSVEWARRNPSQSGKRGAAPDDGRINRGPVVDRANLKRLGAVRVLRSRVSHSDAVARTKAASKDGRPIYARSPDWSVAHAEMLSAIRTIYPRIAFRPQ